MVAELKDCTEEFKALERRIFAFWAIEVIVVILAVRVVDYFGSNQMLGSLSGFLVAVIIVVVSLRFATPSRATPNLVKPVTEGESGHEETECSLKL